jgi:hypothetical protein
MIVWLLRALGLGQAFPRGLSFFLRGGLLQRRSDSLQWHQVGLVKAGQVRQQVRPRAGDGSRDVVW